MARHVSFSVSKRWEVCRRIFNREGFTQITPIPQIFDRLGMHRIGLMKRDLKVLTFWRFSVLAWEVVTGFPLKSVAERW